MALPYVVRFGYGESSAAYLRDFGTALSVYRRLREGGHDARLLNVDLVDGAPDASPWAQVGLSEEEWLEVANG